MLTNIMVTNSDLLALYNLISKIYNHSLIKSYEQITRYSRKQNLPLVSDWRVYSVIGWESVCLCSVSFYKEKNCIKK